MQGIARNIRGAAYVMGSIRRIDLYNLVFGSFWVGIRVKSGAVKPTKARCKLVVIRYDFCVNFYFNNNIRPYFAPFVNNIFKRFSFS